MTERQKRRREELKSKNEARLRLELTTKRVGYKKRLRKKRREIRLEKRAKLVRRLDTIPNGVWTEAKEAAIKKYQIPVGKVHATEDYWYISPDMDYTLCGKKFSKKIKTDIYLKKITCMKCKKLLAKLRCIDLESV